METISLLDEPIAVIAFAEKYEEFWHDEEYSGRRIQEIEKVRNEAIVKVPEEERKEREQLNIAQAVKIEKQAAKVEQEKKAEEERIRLDAQKKVTLDSIAKAEAQLVLQKAEEMRVKQGSIAKSQARFHPICTS